jgi:hypothetical protein
MFAVMIEVDVRGVDRESGLQATREHVVPAIRQMPGFHSGTWLLGDELGKGLSLTVWDTVEHAEAMAERFGPGTGPAGESTVLRSEIREVAATA